MTTVLIVDDGPTLRAIIADILLGEGYTVVTAQDGQEALGLPHEEADWLDRPARSSATTGTGTRSMTTIRGSGMGSGGVVCG